MDIELLVLEKHKIIKQIANYKKHAEHCRMMRDKWDGDYENNLNDIKGFEDYLAQLETSIKQYTTNGISRTNQGI
jgi:hypothetical protein